MFFMAADGELLFSVTAKMIPCALATWFLILSTDEGVLSAYKSSLNRGTSEMSAHSKSKCGLLSSTIALKIPALVDFLRNDPLIRTTLSFYPLLMS